VISSCGRIDFNIFINISVIFNQKKFSGNIILFKIPEIIAHPDHIGKHPSKNSIEYIRRIDELFIVAVRIKSGKLALRTAFHL
jgi:hypothetical protein